MSPDRVKRLPVLVRPMLATAGPPPAGDGWALEFKWDGIRAVSYVDRGRVRVLSRNDLDITARYPELAALSGPLADRQAVLDGEVVALDGRARPSFALLQRRMHVRPSLVPPLVAEVPVAYMVFDVLYLDGHSLLEAPYEVRRAALTGLGLDQAGGGRVMVPPELLEEQARDVLAAAEERGLEGIVAKRLGSTYRPAARSRDWVKTRIYRAQEVVLIGWKPGQGRRENMIGSLLFAVPDPEAEGALRFAGHVGTGFTDTALRDLADQLAPLRRDTPPVGGDIPREHARGVQWVDLALVGEVVFATWAPDGLLRHPTWRGLRPDKTPDQIRREP
jgi:bifunctional non-homologous end joining protein LigD